MKILNNSGSNVVRDRELRLKEVVNKPLFCYSRLTNRKNYMISKKKYLDKISSHFPKLNWEKTKYVSSGFDSDVIILDDNIIFRFPKNSYSRDILKDEISLLKFLKKRIDFEVPNYTYITKDFSFGGYEMIKGSGLSIGLLKKLSSVAKNKLASQVGKFLTQLHTTPVAKVKKYNPRPRSAKVELASLSKDVRKYLFPTFLAKERFICEDFFSNLNLVVDCKYEKVLIHGDFSNDHIIVDSKNNLVGVIDFTDKALHDPAFDFIFLWEFGSAFVKQVYRHYDGHGKEGLLERSIVFAKASALWNMVQAKRKGRLNYSKSYKRFKRLCKYSIPS